MDHTEIGPLKEPGREKNTGKYDRSFNFAPSAHKLESKKCCLRVIKTLTLIGSGFYNTTIVPTYWKEGSKKTLLQMMSSVQLLI
jgi:hypothetical protein